MIRNLWKRSGVATLVVVGIAWGASSAAAASDPWARGAQWMSVRAGYAKASSDDAGNGWAGYGIGYRRMLNRKWSLGIYAHHEVLAHTAGATQVEIPLTAEIARHYKWKTSLRPYIGAGSGVFLYGQRRTGDDYRDVRKGGYVVWGADTPLNDRQLLGLDTRLMLVEGFKYRVNPVFGTEKSTLIQWSVKLNWSFAY